MSPIACKTTRWASGDITGSLCNFSANSRSCGGLRGVDLASPSKNASVLGSSINLFPSSFGALLNSLSRLTLLLTEASFHRLEAQCALQSLYNITYRMNHLPGILLTSIL